MHIQILSRAPRGRQNTIERQGKDLATRGAARGLVSLSAYLLAKGKSTRGILRTLHVVDLARHRHRYYGMADSHPSF